MNLRQNSGRITTYLSVVAGGLGLLLATLMPGGAPRSATLPASSPQPQTKITFAHDIAPIFQKNCLPCHGGDKPQGGLRLDSEANALKGGESGKAIIPGNSGKSSLVKRLLGEGEDERMPAGADPLPAAQIKLIREWIDQNAFAETADTQPAATGQTPSASSAVMPVAAHAPTAGSGTFVDDIRPILAARCYQCHGRDLQQNGLRMDSLAALLKGSANGPVVIPGDSEKSPLVRRLMALDRPQMPYGGPPLSAEQISLIRKWIDSGARGPDSAVPMAAGKPVKHWAYVKPVRPAVPAVKDAAWCRNPMDNFVLARL